MARPPLADPIDRLLPQTQCTRCGYPACRPYAEAIAAGEADINRCPPGGDALIRTLAALTGRAYRPLDPICGEERPRRVALVDEPRCIGCTLCIQACPVDAIVGAPKRMHTVVAELCTGCELCVPPCPVDCISMVTAPDAARPWDGGRAAAARERYLRRERRLASRPPLALARPDADARRASIEAALARARARRAAFAARREKSER
jgi:electron transport complex protein RnfB